MNMNDNNTHLMTRNHVHMYLRWYVALKQGYIELYTLQKHLSTPYKGKK
jgi:hypothetical protein